MALKKLTGIDQGYLSKWLNMPRGVGNISAKHAYKLMKALDIEADRLWNTPPDPDYLRTYVPHAKGEDPPGPLRASGATAHPPRRSRGGGSH